MAAVIIKSYHRTTPNTVVIIVGASINEPHIQMYAASNPDCYIVTISDEHKTTVCSDGSICPNNTHIGHDFNNVGVWVDLAQWIRQLGIPLQAIIVDTSTANFFGPEWNFTTGRIAEIVFEMLTTSTEYM